MDVDITTKVDKTSQRPQKKRLLSPASLQRVQLERLLEKPDREIRTDKPRERGLPPPPEILSNVQGSSSGAGSGEFHVYKAARRRETERLKAMDEEVSKEQAARDFEAKQRDLAEADQSKTAKNRRKREKAKERKEQTKDKELGMERAPMRLKASSTHMTLDDQNEEQGRELSAPVPIIESTLIIHDED